MLYTYNIIIYTYSSSRMDKSNLNTNTKPILAYWNFRGLVQDLRFLLKYLNVEYEDKRYPPGPNFGDETWLVEKFQLELDFPNVPYWIDGDIKLSESRAILKFLARSKGPSLVPADALLQAQAEILEGVGVDLQHALVRFCYTNEVPLEPIEDTLNPKFCQLAAFIGKNGNLFCMGEKLYWIDFYIYEVLKQFTKYKPSIFAEKPQLEKYIQKFENIPELAEYIKSPAVTEDLCYSRKGRIVF